MAVGTYGRRGSPLTEYTVRAGTEQVLGRYDMFQQNLYVSRAQCLVSVAADGVCTLVSIGKPPTVFRPHGDTSWYSLTREDGPYFLQNGDHIGLVWKEPEAAFYQVACEDGQSDGIHGVAQLAQHGDYHSGTWQGFASGSIDRMQYSDDGQWMWNGHEWVPTAGF